MQTSSSMVTGEGSLGCSSNGSVVLSVAVSAALLLFGATVRPLRPPGPSAGRTDRERPGYLLVSSAGEFYAYGNAHPWTNAIGSSGIASVAVTADGQGRWPCRTAASSTPTAPRTRGRTSSAPAASSASPSPRTDRERWRSPGPASSTPTAPRTRGRTSSAPARIVGVAITADGQGALAVSDTGQFYAYGTAHAWTNPTGFTNRITSVAMTADGQGAVAMSDRGQFYAYGTARPQTNPTGFTGSMVGVKLTADGQGLTAMSSSGQIYAYGTSAWLGNGDPGQCHHPDHRGAAHREPRPGGGGQHLAQP